MSEDEQDNAILTERRKAIGKGIGILTGLAAMGGLTVETLAGDNDYKQNALKPAEEEFFDDLTQFKSEKFDVSPANAHISEYGFGLNSRGLELEVQVPDLVEDIARSGDVEDSSKLYEDFEASVEDAKEVLLSEAYLEEGRELFGMYANHFKDLEGLDEITLTYIDDSPDLDWEGFEMEILTDEIGANPEEQYDNFVSSYLKQH